MSGTERELDEALWSGRRYVFWTRDRGFFHLSRQEMERHAATLDALEHQGDAVTFHLTAASPLEADTMIADLKRYTAVMRRTL